MTLKFPCKHKEKKHPLDFDVTSIELNVVKWLLNAITWKPHTNDGTKRCALPPISIEEIKGL